jgi:pre-mRNA-splicing factor SYF1
VGHVLTPDSTDVNFIASHALARSQQQLQQTGGEDDDMDDSNAMAALERQARAPVGFVAAGSGPEGPALPLGNAKVASNPDALDINLDD